MTRAALALLRNPRKWWRERLHAERVDGYMAARNRALEAVRLGVDRWKLSPDERNGYGIAALDITSALDCWLVPRHISSRSLFPLLALLLLAAPCEARTWRFTLTDFCYTGPTCAPDSTQAASMSGFVNAYYQRQGDPNWYWAAYAQVDSMAGAFGSFEWEPSTQGVYRLYAETVSTEGITSCKRDTTEWIPIDPRIPPPPKWWHPGQP